MAIAGDDAGGISFDGAFEVTVIHWIGGYYS